MDDQWRTDQGYFMGLDFNVMPFIFDLYEIPKKNRLTVFEQVKMISSYARQEISRQNKRKLDQAKRKSKKH